MYLRKFMYRNDIFMHCIELQINFEYTYLFGTIGVCDANFNNQTKWEREREGGRETRKAKTAYHTYIKMPYSYSFNSI